MLGISLMEPVNCALVFVIEQRRCSGFAFFSRRMGCLGSLLVSLGLTLLLLFVLHVL